MQRTPKWPNVDIETYADLGTRKRVADKLGISVEEWNGSRPNGISLRIADHTRCLAFMLERGHTST